MSKPFNNSLTESPAYNTRSKMAAPSTSISTPATSYIAVDAPAAGSTLMPPCSELDSLHVAYLGDGPTWPWALATAKGLLVCLLAKYLYILWRSVCFVHTLG